MGFSNTHAKSHSAFNRWKGRHISFGILRPSPQHKVLPKNHPMHSWESGGIKPVARHGIGNARQHRKFLYVQSLIGITLAANLADVNSSELFVTGHGRCVG